MFFICFSTVILLGPTVSMHDWTYENRVNEKYIPLHQLTYTLAFHDS